ncbi:MAG: hypothetical protein J6Y38_00625 [Bacteroidaceae bacterium]|nr:hypothetical protein [Bacteroidaceae bacterium]
MEYKTTYTKKEIDELVDWFTTHTFEKELDMGGGINIRDVQMAIGPLIYMAQTQYENKTFSGQIYFLFRIRDELLKQNKVTGEK